MAACSPWSSTGVAFEKLGRLVHHGASNGPEGSLLHVHCMKSNKGTEDHAGGHLTGTSTLMPNNNQASRFASIAVAAATAWAGLSMCPPLEALAMAYEGDHHNVGESVFYTSTSMLQLSGFVELHGDFDMTSEFYEEDGIHIIDADIKADIANVPSIKPPNEGLNSPWVPKINGLKKKDDNKRAPMRCPKWTERELEMVLPDFQGLPKPFPRMQGRLYPFWPATAPTNDKGNDDNYKNPIQGEFKQSSDESLFVSKSESDLKTLHTSPAPPPLQPQMPIKKPSCFTM